MFDKIKDEAANRQLKNIKWIVGSAEKLPLKKNSCDYYTISFGLRNTKNLNQSLAEAYRVLKPGGRYVAKDMWQAGGVPMLLKTLYEGGFIHGNCMTVTGKTMKENLKNVKFNLNQKVLRKYNNPLSPDGGVVG